MCGAPPQCEKSIQLYEQLLVGWIVGAISQQQLTYPSLINSCSWGRLQVGQDNIPPWLQE